MAFRRTFFGPTKAPGYYGGPKLNKKPGLYYDLVNNWYGKETKLVAKHIDLAKVLQKLKVIT